MGAGGIKKYSVRQQPAALPISLPFAVTVTACLDSKSECCTSSVDHALMYISLPQPEVCNHNSIVCQVAPVWTDAMDDEARGAWESAVAAADIVMLNELAYERHREQLQDKRLILLTSDASATLSTCEPPTL